MSHHIDLHIKGYSLFSRWAIVSWKVGHNISLYIYYLSNNDKRSFLASISMTVTPY